MMGETKQRRPKSLVTMRDVALRAGVSYTTVSYVLNQRPSPRGIGEETRRRVLQTAAELGYHPNEIARAIVTGKARVLAFVTRGSQADLEFKSRLLLGVQEEAARQGYLVKVLSIGDGETRISDVVTQCLSWRVTALMAISLAAEEIAPLHAALTVHAVPVITMEDWYTGQKCDGSVRSDIAHGLRLLLAHLHERNHRRIAYLAPHRGDPNGKEREALLRESALSLQMSLQVAYGDWWDLEENESAARTLLSARREERPTAILANGDAAGLIVQRVARESFGLRVPQDLSVVGFGDYTMAAYADPPLTTVAQPFRELGIAAVKQILSPDFAGDAHAAVLPTRLVVRRSTGDVLD